MSKLQSIKDVVDRNEIIEVAIEFLSDIDEFLDARTVDSTESLELLVLGHESVREIHFSPDKLEAWFRLNGYTCKLIIEKCSYQIFKSHESRKRN